MSRNRPVEKIDRELRSSCANRDDVACAHGDNATNEARYSGGQVWETAISLMTERAN